MSIQSFLRFRHLMEAAGSSGLLPKINGMSVMSPLDFLKKELGAQEVEKELQADQEADQEVDEEATPLDEFNPFLGVTRKSVDPEDFNDFLHRSKTKSKTKQDKFHYPYVHPSSIKKYEDENGVVYTDDKGNPYDIEDLKAEIKQRPTSILRQNQKIQHSGGDFEKLLNIGIPALRGLVVDEETNELIIVNTCPGAGDCQLFCYAMKGNYIRCPATWLALSHVLNYLLNDPDGFVETLSVEIQKELDKVAKFDKKKEKEGLLVQPTKIVLRWHDAGDFFSPEYLEVAYELCRRFPTVEFYCYTKLASIALNPNKPKNFMTTFSLGARADQEIRINLKTNKYADRPVPKELWYDLIARDDRKLLLSKEGRMQWKSRNAQITFERRMAHHYDIDIKRILSYPEMMAKKAGTKLIWFVYVMPGKDGDGDDAAKRKDVLGVFNLYH